MNKSIKIEENIVSGNITRKIAIALFLAAFVIRTIKDVAYTMVNYQYFNSDMLWAFGISLFACVFLITFKNHAELLLIPLTANVLFDTISWIKSLSYQFIFPIPLLVEIAFVAIIILALCKKIPAKVVNIVAIFKGVYAIYTYFIKDIVMFGSLPLDNIDIFQVVGNFGLALAFALVFVGSKFEEAEPISFPKVIVASNIYTIIVCVVSGIMMFYGTVIVAAGREVKSYTDMSGNPVFYLADRICPYVWTYLIMIVVTLLIKFILLPILFSNKNGK